MNYKELEASIRAQASAITAENSSWTAAEVARRLEKIADSIAQIRMEHEPGIDASMGKRSGWKVDI